MIEKQGDLFMAGKVLLGARILLGLIFTVFGLNGLMMILTGTGFIPMPPVSPEMQAVMGGFFGAKYLMPLVKILEIVGGLLLLSGRYLNLAILLLGPIMVNIAGIHFFVDQGGLAMTIFMLVLFAIILRARWSAFRQLLCE